jgi:hypothetical protein
MFPFAKGVLRKWNYTWLLCAYQISKLSAADHLYPTD